MKKYQHNIDLQREVLPTPGSTATAVATSKSSRKTGSLRKRENLEY